MSDIPFHITYMGKKFYEGTVPEILKELKQVNQNLERIALALEKQGNQNTGLLTEDS